MTRNKQNKTNVVCTIYNYKDGKNYLGDEGLDAGNLTDWHVGCEPGYGDIVMEFREQIKNFL